MNESQIYIVVAIITLLIIFLLLFAVRKTSLKSRLSPLAGLAFGFVLAGILFGDDRILGYALMGIGVLIAVMDIVKQLKKGNGTGTAGVSNH